MNWLYNYRRRNYYKKALRKSRVHIAVLERLDEWLLQEEELRKPCVEADAELFMESAPLFMEPDQDTSDDEFVHYEDVYAKPVAAPYKAYPDVVASGRAPLPGAASRFGAPVRKSRSLEDLVRQKEETFQQMLLRLIREKGYTNAQVYKKANQDRRQFSKIRNNADYQPSRRTALAYVIALKLNMDEAKDLLARAGYAFSPSSTSDKIIAFFIENEVYDIYTIDTALYEHGQETLCGY